jgi:ubiquinol-cytochrome c reductase cytochrome c subunit
MRYVHASGLAALAASLVTSLVIGCGAALAASAENGKAAFIQHGCWQCHGFQGQGGIAGPKLAPDPMPVEALTAFVRGSNRFMPPYQQSIPQPADYKSIPLLNR